MRITLLVRMKKIIMNVQKNFMKKPIKKNVRFKLINKNMKHK